MRALLKHLKDGKLRVIKKKVRGKVEVKAVMADQAFVTCENKRRHVDECTARAAAMDSITRPGSNVQRLWIYRCPVCNGWHLTRNNQANARLVTADEPVHSSKNYHNAVDTKHHIADNHTSSSHRS